jgi:cell division protein FtsI/penicillin-binding protein 2
MKRKSGNIRFFIILFFVLVITGCVLTRLFYLQVLMHGVYSAIAAGQHGLDEKIIAKRGEIFIQENAGVWHPLAVNRDYPSVYLVPKEIKDKKQVAKELASLIEVPEDKIIDKLKNLEDPYEPLQTKISDETAAKIKSLKLPGVYLGSDSLRWYPQGELASQVLGFVGAKNDQRVGQYGIEGYYENILAGKNGFLKSQKDALGQWLVINNYDFEPAQDGDNLYLTLDQNIQYIVEQKLKAVMEKWGSSVGCAIVMEPKTGAIRAMAGYPNFNPNEYNRTEDINVFINPCTQKNYEPGSVFKPVTMAAGLDTNKVTPETTYTDTGTVQIGGYVIKNAAQRSYGLSTMTKVLEKSINTGAIFVQRLVGGEIFKKYIDAFGFGERTGIDLEGEALGNTRNLEENREINFATASFGQGISVTSIQMASAIGAIANDGKLMKPHLIEKIVHADGQEILVRPEILRQVISPSAAGKLTAMLVSTVRNGYDKIKIKDYFVAGKTGTAQIPSEDKLGYSDQTIHTFAGYAPAYNPKFLIFLQMEKPQGINFASDSLAPVFSDLAQFLFNYYEIPPEE